ncbi:MAG: hypothetical protein HY303_20925 [Candidatus Wallbacteria bacterium]|nr:hypothetical protein [Candidatus Wallbacteria bacterium]
MKAIVLLFWVALPALALAHGGEDHGDKPAPAASVARGPTAGVTGDLFEILVKYTPVVAGKPMELKVFVADPHTNEPVRDAQVELTLAGKTEVKAIAKPAPSPGFYTALVTLPGEGDYDTSASVTHGTDADFMALGAIHAGLPPATAIPPHEHPAAGPGSDRIAAAVFLVVAILLGAARAARSSKRGGCCEP